MEVADQGAGGRAEGRRGEGSWLSQTSRQAMSSAVAMTDDLSVASYCDDDVVHAFLQADLEDLRAKHATVEREAAAAAQASRAMEAQLQAQVEAKEQEVQSLEVGGGGSWTLAAGT